MADLKIPVVDLTSRDYESLRDDAIARIQFFTPEWTDHNPTDFGIVLIEMMAFIGGGLHYQIDVAANECFLATAVKRESVAQLLQLIGYRMRGPTAATVDLVMTIPAQADTVTVSVGDVAQTTGSPVLTWEVQEANVFAVGETTKTLKMKEGTTYQDTIGTSDSSENQRFTLVRDNIIDDSLIVLANSVEWDWVESLVTSGPADKHYTTEVAPDGKLVVVFGDGVNGEIPTGGIESISRIGGGVAGNVGAGTITSWVTQLYAGAVPITPTSVTNPQAAAGGDDEEALEFAKVAGPASLKALGRGVTLEDYETLSLSVAGIGKVQAYVRGVNTVVLVVVPSGGGTASSALIADLTNYIETVKMATDSIAVEQAQYVKLSIEVTVNVFPRFKRATIKVAVDAAIDAFLLLDNRLFGKTGTQQGSVRLGDLYGLIEAIEGVDYADITLMTIYPVPEYEVWTGDATISEVSVGTTAVDEWWIVLFTSAVAFSVVGTVSGSQGTGTVGVAFAATNGAVSFTITAGTVPQATGDRIAFRTSQYVGNVQVNTGEIAELEERTTTYVGGIG